MGNQDIPKPHHVRYHGSKWCSVPTYLQETKRQSRKAGYRKSTIQSQEGRFIVKRWNYVSKKQS